MAAVITMTTDGAFGVKPANPLFVTLASIALDSAYPAAGYDIATLLNLKDYLLNHTLIHVIAQEDGNFRYTFNQAAGTLHVHDLDTGVEASENDDVSAATAVKLTIISQ